MMNRSPGTVAALLFGSGFCALIYQTAWLRQFRLIFGASTFATAAVEKVEAPKIRRNCRSHAVW